MIHNISKEWIEKKLMDKYRLFISRYLKIFIFIYCFKFTWRTCYCRLAVGSCVRQTNWWIGGPRGYTADTLDFFPSLKKSSFKWNLKPMTKLYYCHPHPISINQSTIFPFSLQRYSFLDANVDLDFFFIVKYIKVTHSRKMLEKLKFS